MVHVAYRFVLPNGDDQQDQLFGVYYWAKPYQNSVPATRMVVVRDQAGVLVRTLDSGTSAVCNAGAISCGTFTWDGTDEHRGGRRRRVLHRPCHRHRRQPTSATLDIPITLDRRVPGTITQPSSGGVVSGVATFEFTPTVGFAEIRSVSFSGRVWVGDGVDAGCRWGVAVEGGHRALW